MLSAPCSPEGEVAYLLLVDDSGQRVRFSVESGRVVSVTSASGKTLTAEERASNLKTLFDEQGRLTASFSPTSGLMQVEEAEDGAKLVSWFSPEQVTQNADGSFSTAGEPYKTVRYSITYLNGVRTTTVTRQQRGLPPHTVTDMFGRTISTTDAAGNTTATEYCENSDLPAKVTDALGNTTCYAYDARGRKIAEWGTAIQPACFGYDAADRMTSLTTFRGAGETINTDPRNRTDGDTTTWNYHDTTGLELRKTYADGSQVLKTYDAFNRLATETDARGVVKTHTYDPARGLLLRSSYSDATTPREFAYNHLGQLTQLTDDAGTRTFSYNAFDEAEVDSLLADGITHTITEQRDEFGRSSGYIYIKDGAVQQTVTTGYAKDGRISSAGFEHWGEMKTFTYRYLSGSNLLEKLTHPSGITLTQAYEPKRNLLTQMSYHRGDTLVAQRTYAYDALGRPTQRDTARNGSVMHDTFEHNTRSELVNAQVNGGAYTYAYDNIGNRESAQEAAEEATQYEANALNQYTAVGDFTPQFDAAGNQTLVKTSTGIWRVTYNAENRPTTFTSEDGFTVVNCTYDTQGRRATKKVTTNGEVTLHHRYIYRGYLQIAACDLMRSWHPALWYLLWDPTQATATRPLAIQKDGTWYTYGWDLTKNICELYGSSGYIRTTYTYSPYGSVTAAGDVEQPIQWSSEFHDDELGLVYYNYRYYNTIVGRWIGVDPVFSNLNLYMYTNNNINTIDYLGLVGLLRCKRYRWVLTLYGENKKLINNVRFTSICDLKSTVPPESVSKNNCCKCNKEINKLKKQTSGAQLEKLISQLENCLKKEYPGTITVTFSNLYANIGTHDVAAGVDGADGTKKNQFIPAGWYRIKGGNSETYGENTPGITGLNINVPGSPVHGRGQVWVHRAWGNLPPENPETHISVLNNKLDKEEEEQKGRKKGLHPG